MPSKLSVGNLAYAVTHEDLAAYFARAGQVQKATVVTDKFSGQSRGFGFVEMADQESAQRAIDSLNETDLKGRRLKIDMARETAPRTGGGGGGGGDFRRGGGRGGDDRRGDSRARRY